MLFRECVLSVDGDRFEVTSSSSRLTYRLSKEDARRLQSLKGRTGVLSSTSGIVLLRLRIADVDLDGGILFGETGAAEDVHEVRRPRTRRLRPAPNEGAC